MGKNNSIIQSTLVRLSVLIFCIFLVLYFYIARIYWDKEVYQRELELLTIASATAAQVQEKLEEIEMYKQDETLIMKEKEEAVYSVLQSCFNRISNENPNISLGFYDYEINKAFSFLAPNHTDSIMISFPKISSDLSSANMPEFLLDEGLTAWDGKGVIGAIMPAYYQENRIGNIFAILNTDKAIFTSYFEYTRILVLGIVLWLLVLMIIKKYLKNIEVSLDNFSRMIVENNLDNQQVLSGGFPELVPVLERIKGHLNNLTELNTELEYSNEKLITIMEGIKDGFFSLDKQWRFTFVNKVARKKMKNDDLLGKEIWEEYEDNLEPFTSDKLREAARTRQPVHWEAHSAKEDRYYEYHAYPFSRGISVFFRDITDNKRQEMELIRLERLNLIGQLAAGISHEVRNPLTTVRGFLQMLETRTDSKIDSEYIDIMISEIDRANGIITDFLSLARINAETTKKVNINDIIMKLFPMIQADAFNSNKDIVTDLSDVPALELNESEIRQLILNLVRNGLEETPEGGKVTISTSCRDDHVILSVRDEGQGIPLEIREKIGTPFMTTKETGTGLGLAISMGIAARHKAKFEFETGETGTTFQILFPC